MNEKIKLIPLEEEHIETLRKWRNDEQIKKYFLSWKYISKIEHKNWFENYCNDDTQIIFAIIENENNNFIGTIGFSNINHFHQHAETGTLIGNKDYWGKGYATLAMLKIIEFGFETINLKKIYARVLETNIGSIKKNERCGFRVEGQLRNHIFNNGEFRDVIMMRILKDEYNKQK